MSTEREAWERLSRVVKRGEQDARHSEVTDTMVRVDLGDLKRLLRAAPPASDAAGGMSEGKPWADADFEHFAGLLAERPDGDGLAYNDHHVTRENVRALLNEALRLRAGGDDAARLETEHRQWALNNVKRHHRELECRCMELDTCVKCAYEIGRREGQVEAGAYYTQEEAFALLRAAQSSPFIPEERARAE